MKHIFTNNNLQSNTHKIGIRPANARLKDWKKCFLFAALSLPLFSLMAFSGQAYLNKGGSFFERMLTAMKIEVAERLTDTNTFSQKEVNQLLSIHKTKEGMEEETIHPFQWMFAETTFTWEGAGSGNEMVWTTGQNSGTTTITDGTTNITVDVDVVDNDNVYYNGNQDGGNSTNGLFGLNGLTIWLDNNENLYDANPMDLGEEASFTFDFSTPVALVELLTADIDWRNATGITSRWRDVVQVTAIDHLGNNVPLTAALVSPSSTITIDNVNQVATADYNPILGSDGGLDWSAPESQVTWNSNGDFIKTLTVTYRVGVATSGQQSLLIGAIKVDTDGNPTLAPCSNTCYVVRDNFDNAVSSESYANQDGSNNWTSDWMESDDDGDPASGDVQINGTEELVFDNDDASPPALRRSLNMAGADIATLSVHYIFASGVIFEANDQFAIEISNDNGVTYTILETIDNTFNEAQVLSFDITNYIDNDVVVRLRVLSGFAEPDEFMLINQVEVVACNLKVSVTHTADSYSTCSTTGTGEIAVLGYNGEAPYEYSIDGVNFQSSELFTDLLPNTYTLTVRDNQSRTCTTTATVGITTDDFASSCSINVTGADNVLEQEYIIDFVADTPNFSGGDGTSAATITGNVLNAADNTDAGFDYSIAATVTGGGGNTVNFLMEKVRF